MTGLHPFSLFATVTEVYKSEPIQVIQAGGGGVEYHAFVPSPSTPVATGGLVDPLS